MVGPVEARAKVVHHPPIGHDKRSGGPKDTSDDLLSRVFIPDPASERRSLLNVGLFSLQPEQVGVGCKSDASLDRCLDASCVVMIAFPCAR